MAQFLALTTDDVPDLGSSGTAKTYRGDHATEADAANAAALALDARTGDRIWVCTVASLTRYVATASRSASAAVG